MIGPEVSALDGGQVAVSQVGRGAPGWIEGEGVAVACVGVSVVGAVGSERRVVPPPRVPGDAGARQVHAGL